ncbi:MAG: ABC transporter permease [Bifidobacteriaceae bacterium]|jgi:putative ABC transport system permease protein|nr:ABC transporter permease [Bifidobacteriaceae bacterium]
MSDSQMTRRAMTHLMVRRSLTRRRSRVITAVLAVALGATTLFALASLALDLPQHLSLDLRRYGANLVVVPDNQAITAATAQQVSAALTQAPVVFQAAFRYAPVQINDQPSTLVGGDLTAMRAAKSYWDVEGDWPSGSGEVLLGRDMAQWLDLGLGDEVSLTGTDQGKLAAQVTGIVSAGSSEDGLVILSTSDLQTVTGEAGLFDVIELSVAADRQTLESWSDQLNQSVDGIAASPVTRLVHSEADVVVMVRSLLALVAVLVLALSLIGVATTMMAVVTERRGEIALSLALGATNKAVAQQFLIEGLAVGVTGGLLGVGLGLGLANGISYGVFNRTIAPPAWLAVVTVVVATAVTYLACRGPVKRAGQVDPAVQLREE